MQLTLKLAILFVLASSLQVHSAPARPKSLSRPFTDGERLHSPPSSLSKVLDEGLPIEEGSIYYQPGEPTRYGVRKLINGEEYLDGLKLPSMTIEEKKEYNDIFNAEAGKLKFSKVIKAHNYLQGLYDKVGQDFVRFPGLTSPDHGSRLWAMGLDHKFAAEKSRKGKTSPGQDS